VRHPMYTAVLAAGLAGAWVAATPAGWMCVPLLLAVLWKKSSLEEAWLQDLHPAYNDYRRRTGRFLPGPF
jgi:protein-S-isoprenylcysteine O-methyltransferase Ste14